jgi:curved DNA-binding protein CbpA
MEPQADPFRTLGIAPGASLNEIRSAYRRLAKQYHPDAAGERALPRFLAIQSAYEQLVDGEGRLRPPGWGTSKGAPGPTARSSGEAWRADPNRARASRDAWRARRSTGSTPGSRASSGSSSRSGTGTASGGAGTRPPGERQHHARRGPRKATPGSTSYDEAAETPLDPAWEGGAWYGPSSGTYWTINPREYADPRKHGPEYLARARRATGDEAPPKRTRRGPAPGASASDPVPDSRTEPPDEGEWAWTGASESTTTGGQAEWGARSWRFETREPGPGAPAWTPGPEGRERPAGDQARATDTRSARSSSTSMPGPRPTAPASSVHGPDIEDLLRNVFPERLLAASRRDVRWRLMIALIAWLPIGYGLSASVSAATGCARYAATCPEPVPILLILVQPLIVAALFAVPVAAAASAFATMAGLVLWMPFGVVLSLLSWPDAPDPVALAALFAVAYGVALVVGATRIRRPSGPAR